MRDVGDDVEFYESLACYDCGLYYDGWKKKWYVDCSSFHFVDESVEYRECSTPAPVDLDAIQRVASHGCSIPAILARRMCDEIERLRGKLNQYRDEIEPRLERAEGHVTRLNRHLGFIIEQRDAARQAARIMEIATTKAQQERDEWYTIADSRLRQTDGLIIQRNEMGAQRDELYKALVASLHALEFSSAWLPLPGAYEKTWAYINGKNGTPDIREIVERLGEVAG